MRAILDKKLLLLFLFWGEIIFANNVSITNARVIASDTTNLQTTVEFDISWENSWRTSAAPGNHDAAWVFIKYRESGGSWKHAWLNNTGHTAPSGSTIDIGLVDPGTAFNSTTNPGVGAFIYRNADGAGTFSLTDVQLKWNYGANGLTNLSIADVQIYAIEMVYVPQGSFYVGSGGTESGSFTDGSWRGTNGTTPSIPYQITSENALTIDSVAGNLWGTSTSGDNSIGGVGTLPASFPKGYKAFYCMKHGISQQGYVNFLNTLNRTQQASRVATVLKDTTTWLQRCYVMRNSSQVIFRQGIRCDTSFAPYVPITFYCDYSAGGTWKYVPPPINANVWRGNGIGGEADDGLGTVCNWISWLDIAAYLDWAGLRPITEMEYEKACRGDQAPVPNEYVWGVTDLPTKPVSMNNPGQITEVASNAAANQSFGGAGGGVGTTAGPARVGAFATATSTRAEAGAGYYGVLDMGGTLWHHVISVGFAGGRAFTGDHGDGMVDATGNNNVASWPGTGGFLTNTGAGVRGGTYWRPESYMKTSLRALANWTQNNANLNTRWDSTGGRGGRTAP
ncbi:MAG: SUMF1/EgtB/PvdO family nonheme iron enzyme [Bacteroidia bacterium]|nr:SUMF1/EgtB/PvdO family nonheme iron enzyme [Bacteroidia bacterium]